MMLQSADLLMFAEVQRLRQGSLVCWPYAESIPKYSG